jgi:flagellin
LSSAIAAGAVAANTVVAAEDLTISGPLGTTAPALDIGVGQTADSITALVNANEATTGVTADARTQVRISSVAVASYTFTLGSRTTDAAGNTTNFDAAGITVNVTSANDLSGLADAINQQAGVTGVTALSEGSTLVLTNEEGRDITLDALVGAGSSLTVQGLTSTGANSGAADVVSAAADDAFTVGGSISFNAASAFTVTSANAGGLFAATTANASALSNVASANIGTQSGAQAAIAVVDAAIQGIDSLRAGIGAVQNRLQSTISNLQSISENVSAARSRIQDADFAAETASLTRNQILQQAGISVLAQANALPQQVLSLLQ